MANSKYEYVKTFERPDTLLPNTWIVVRIDGRGFHKLSAKYGFEKPNDRRALDLMNAAAMAVMSELPDVVVAYGFCISEIVFVVREEGEQINNNRRFDLHGILHPPMAPLLSGPVPDAASAKFRRPSGAVSYSEKYERLFVLEAGRLYVLAIIPFARPYVYPLEYVRDEIATHPFEERKGHINNLYNTTFWALALRGGMGATEAEEALKGSYAADKNEILFSKFGINYNNEAEIYRKGSVCYRDYGVLTTKSTMNPSSGEDIGEEDTEGMAEEREQSKTQREKERKRKAKAPIVVEHVDIIKDEFWARRPWLLSDKPGRADNKPVQ